MKNWLKPRQRKLPEASESCEITRWRILNEATTSMSKAETLEEIMAIISGSLNKMGFQVVTGEVLLSSALSKLRFISYEVNGNVRLHQFLDNLISSARTIPLNTLPFEKAALENGLTEFVTLNFDELQNLLKTYFNLNLDVSPINDHQTVSFIIAPIYNKYIARHLIFVASKDVSPNDIPAITAFINMGTAFMEEKGRIKEQKQIDQTLQEVGKIVSSSLDLSTVLGRILEQLATVISYDSAAVSLESNNTLKLEAGRGFSNIKRVLNVGVPSGTNILYQEMKQNGKPIVINDIRKDPRYDLWAGTGAIRAWIGIPLMWKNKVIGQISIDSFTSNAFTEEDGDLAFAFAQHAATAIENSRLYKKVNDYANNLAEQVEARTAEIRSQKEQTDAILAGAADAIYITSPDGIIEYINPAFTTLTGYFPEDIIGQKPGILRSNQTPLSVQRQMWQTILQGKVWRGDLKNKRKDNSLYDADLTIAPIFNHHGEIDKFVAIQRDISKLKEVDRLKTEFLSTAAHELRSPLTTIKGYAELLLHRGDFSQTEIERFVGYIYEQAIHLAGLVSDLLDVSKIEAGAAFAISPELLNPQPVFEKTVAHWRSREPNHQIDLIEPDSWPEVEADPARLEQALNNLLSNAIKYSSEGESVVVTVHRSPANLRVSVRDQGIGMTLDEQRHVFEKFWRADAGSTAVEGTGLGMVIVKHIVESHGGKIWISSRQGEGTTVNFTIPLMTGAATILIIEDDLKILEVQERLLAMEGYQVLVAGTPTLGLDLAVAQHPDLIILDLMLPEMSGEELLRHFKATPAIQDIPVIVVSAKSGLTHIENAFNLGAVDFMTKPFDFDEYLGRIKMALNKM